jgi:hypothetical protein
MEITTSIIWIVMILIATLWQGEYRTEKSWDSEIVIDNQQKSGVRKQSLKKKGHYFAARRTKEHVARRSSRRAQEQR